MKTKVRTKVRIAALLATGGFVLGLMGNCVPDNFWIDTWGNSLSGVVDGVFNTYVFSQLTGLLGV